MILDACGGRGNGTWDAEGLARAGRGGGGRKGEQKGGDVVEGRQQWRGGDGERRDRWGAAGKGRLGGNNRDWKMGKGVTGRGGERVEMGMQGVGRGRQGWDKGEGEKKGQEEGGFTDGYDGMPKWT